MKKMRNLTETEITKKEAKKKKNLQAKNSFKKGKTQQRTSMIEETRIQSLGQEGLLEKEMATHSSILAWKNPMDRGTWQATVRSVTKGHTRLSDFTFFLL